MSTSTVSPAPASLDKPPRSWFYVVSVRKLIVMTFFTFGFYLVYWNYRNWATYKRATGEKVIPLLRAFFAVFFLYALLKRVDDGLRARNLASGFSPVLLTLGIVITVMLACAPALLEPGMSTADWLKDVPAEEANYTLLKAYGFMYCVWALQLWLMALVQRAMNFHEADADGKGNSRLTLVNWLWMLPGLLMFTLSLLAWGLELLLILF
jgi:hypothetical protein